MDRLISGAVALGELELIEVLQDPDIEVVDSRKPEQFAKYTVPGAINMPVTDPETALEALGCRRAGEAWDCSGARSTDRPSPSR